MKGRAPGATTRPTTSSNISVQNAVGPVLKENISKVEKIFAEVESLRTKAKRATTAKRTLSIELDNKKHQATKELFSIKVLDPAMGSGHFLVETVDFISD